MKTREDPRNRLVFAPAQRQSVYAGVPRLGFGFFWWFRVQGVGFRGAWVRV